MAASVVAGDIVRRFGYVVVGSGNGGEVSQHRLHRVGPLPTPYADVHRSYPTPFELDLARVTTPCGFSYAEGGWHPYVAALEEHLADPDLPYERSILARYYARSDRPTCRRPPRGRRGTAAAARPLAARAQALQAPVDPQPSAPRAHPPRQRGLGRGTSSSTSGPRAPRRLERTWPASSPCTTACAAGATGPTPTPTGSSPGTSSSATVTSASWWCSATIGWRPSGRLGSGASSPGSIRDTRR
jgi:hypothetical protein